MLPNSRQYLTFNPAVGYPAAKDLFYECLSCGDVIPSLPDDSTQCKCKNIMIDIDYGRIKIQNPALIKLFTTSGP